jgi:hypothetical protein
MTDIVTASSNKLDNWSDSGPWYEGTHGERIAVRVSSLDTNGAYAIVESIAAPSCATPMHLQVATASRSERKSTRRRPGLASSCLRVSLIAGAISPASPDAW